ncbi:DUF192 domain-containing protein [Sphingorhabdus sp. EL138]|uniref:DUF192 domain-containing protein n=1 Tax=Sphingorhabdus sp. EL138 TaxID=2073156 RepID=UPI0025CFAE1D|nr:DUF192 domain-containing protein [Sphingorhabdus sp. EL138]
MSFTQFSRCSAFAIALSLTACNMPANGESPAAGCTPGAAAGQSAAGLQIVTLCVTSAAKTHRFTVEAARTSAEQAKGLMFRTELADNAGMIFPFPDLRIASFWMKNTVIPLDIIFVRADGTIESIADNTVPYSMTPVVSGEPVAAVLELRGGLAAELGIVSGDKVQWTTK